MNSERFDILENPCLRETPLGPMRCVIANALRRDDRFPTLIVASALLVRISKVREHWLLSHLLVEDEARRCGVATEIVRFYEERIGQIDAAWVSDSGRAFAESYVKKFGPRPHWQIGTNPRHEAMINSILARHEKAAGVA